MGAPVFYSLSRALVFVIYGCYAYLSRIYKIEVYSGGIELRSYFGEDIKKSGIC